MLGTWAVSGDAQLSIPVLEGMKNVGGSGVTILYAKGSNITDDTALAKKANVFGEKVTIDSLSPDRLLAQAIEVANRADVIVTVVGESSEMSGEAASRSNINLPENQTRLLEALAKTGKPLVVVLMSGRPLTLLREHALATSMLQVWFSGHEAGNVIADVLFGAYNPSGKLTMTFPQNVGQVPIYYNYQYTGRPQPQGPTQKFRSNYLDVSNEPLFPFGYGLSYTTFSYGDVQLSKTTMRPSESLTASVSVTNTGNFDGEEVVQLYIQDPVASVTQPVKKLKGFSKVFLKKGETKVVTFFIDAERLKFFNSDLKWILEPGAFNVHIGTSSNNVKTASFTVVK
jgi:beta-glucosidase